MAVPVVAAVVVVVVALAVVAVAVVAVVAVAAVAVVAVAAVASVAVAAVAVVVVVVAAVAGVVAVAIGATVAVVAGVLIREEGLDQPVESIALRWTSQGTRRVWSVWGHGTWCGWSRGGLQVAVHSWGPEDVARICLGEAVHIPWARAESRDDLGCTHGADIPGVEPDGRARDVNGEGVGGGGEDVGGVSWREVHSIAVQAPVMK